MVLTKLLTYYAFTKKSFMSTGMSGKASSPESPWSTWTWSHQFGRHKTSGLERKSHSEWWHTPRHAACGQATDDRRGQDAPVLPMRGRWSRLQHVSASNQWKNSIGSMDYGSGSKRFSSTKNSWRARLFKSKRYQKVSFFWIIVFSRNDTASFAGSSTEDHIVMTAYPINHFVFAVLKLLWTAC